MRKYSWTILLLLFASTILPIFECAAAEHKIGRLGHRSARKNQQSSLPGTIRLIAGNPKVTYNLSVPKPIKRVETPTLLIVFRPAQQPSFLTSAAVRRHAWFAAGIVSSKGSAGSRAQAVIADIERRYALKFSRVICAGFSAGAQEAQDATLALDMPTGLISIGYPAFLFGVPRTDFPLVDLVGQSDFNREKVLTAHQNENLRGRPVKLIIHPGGHSWGRQQDLDNIVDWLDGVPLPQKKLEEALRTEQVTPESIEEAKRVVEAVVEKFSKVQTMSVEYKVFSNTSYQKTEYDKVYTVDVSVGDHASGHTYWQLPNLFCQEHHGPITVTEIFDGKKFFRNYVYGGPKSDKYYYLTNKNYYLFSQTPGLDYVLDPDSNYGGPMGNIRYYMGYAAYRGAFPVTKRVAIIESANPGETSRVRVFFDPDTLLPLAGDVRWDGRLRHVTSYCSFLLDTPIDPAHFRFVPPPGKKPIDKDTVN